jgi:hypothetical protein
MAVRKVILEGSKPKSSDFVPHKSTGLNVLEKVLKKIIPSIEVTYKSLTTSQEQRLSYRVHILNAVKNLLAPEDTMAIADQGQLTEKVNVTLPSVSGLKPGQGEPDMSKLIDVDGRFAPKEKSKEELAAAELKKNTIPGTDLTGRNFALETIKQISSSILEGFESLSQKADKDMYYDYLITNLKLYFNRFEEELSGSSELQEPQTPSGQASGV